jgi:pimeloyl-ACP methyl ester carboxylesterase
VNSIVSMGVRGPRGRRSATRAVLIVIVTSALTLAAAVPASAGKFERRPILFVHGFESAGSNWASQAMRFESNGYPHEWVEEIDYNSTAATADKSEVEKQIEEAISKLKQRTGKSQVDVIGHSEGTSVMYYYLAESPKAAEHRASVARYVNVDGQESNPGVPTLALWAGRCGDATCSKPERHMQGAENATIPDATHVQTATSAESFQDMFEFFRGRLPKHDIVPTSRITLAGKALEFPQNTGELGDTVEIWPLDVQGARTSKTPLATFAITDGSTGGGAWGPVAARAGQRYEFVLVKPGGKAIHTYMEPFARSDYAVRILASAALEADTGKFPGSSGAVMIRYEELWGNEPGENDELLVNGLNVCTASLCPWEKEVNAYFAFNWEGKQESTLNEEPVLSQLPFIQGAQVYVPGSTPPNAVVSYQLRSRRGGGLRTLNIPNWEGTTDQVQIFWNDFESLSF